MGFKNKFIIIVSIFIMIVCSGCSQKAMLDDNGKPTNITISEVNQMIADDAVILRQTKDIDLDGETIFKSYETLKQYSNSVDFKTFQTIKALPSPSKGNDAYLSPTYVYLFYDEENNQYKPVSIKDIKILKNTKGEKVLSIKDWKDIIITGKNAERYKNILN